MRSAVAVQVVMIFAACAPRSAPVASPPAAVRPEAAAPGAENAGAPDAPCRWEGPVDETQPLHVGRDLVVLADAGVLRVEVVGTTVRAQVDSEGFHFEGDGTSVLLRPRRAIERLPGIAWWRGPVRVASAEPVRFVVDGSLGEPWGGAFALPCDGVGVGVVEVPPPGPVGAGPALVQRPLRLWREPGAGEPVAVSTNVPQSEWLEERDGFVRVRHGNAREVYVGWAPADAVEKLEPEPPRPAGGATVAQERPALEAEAVVCDAPLTLWSDRGRPVGSVAAGSPVLPSNDDPAAPRVRAPARAGLFSPGDLGWRVQGRLDACRPADPAQ